MNAHNTISESPPFATDLIMGQSLRRLEPPQDVSSFSVDLWPNMNGNNDDDGTNWSSDDESEETERHQAAEKQFPDLSELPPEIALTVLSNLKATDLCLAACVWQKLASDEILWQGLCREQWPEASVYDTGSAGYRKVYLLLDEGTLTFNSDPIKVNHEL